MATSSSHPAFKVATARDLKHLKDVLLKEWHQKIKKLPPDRRLHWLEQAAGLVAHGPRQRRQLTKQLEARRREIEDTAPSAAWIDSAWFSGEPFPVPGMIKSLVAVRLGDATARHRMTSPLACPIEDFLDAMTPREAALYDYPPSASAQVINRIGHYHGSEETTPQRRRGDDRPTHTPEPTGKRPRSTFELLDAIADAADNRRVL